MKFIVIVLFLTCSGCANASPIDIFVPVKKPSPATAEYLGHLYQTNYVANKIYYSLADAKMQKALVPVRKMELEGLYHAAKGELDIINDFGNKLSNGIWGGITALLALAGYNMPSPREKAKVVEALHKKPPE